MVVPSIWMENYPTTVLEGMLSKNLILGSNRGGIPDMLANSRGIIFDIEKSESVIETLDRICNMDNKEYSDIVVDAYNYTKKNNSYDTYYKRIIEVMKDV